LSREALPGLLDHFATYLPPRFASVDVLEEARRLSLIGPRATELESGVSVPGQEDGMCIRVARPPQEGTGFDFLFPDGGAGADELVGALELSGAVPATESDYETWRIEMGIPRFGIDITPDNLPQETGLIERAVSFEKGCYTGQEVVARIHYRGRVQKHLRGLEALESPAGMPAAGLSLSNRGREAGVITSWCISPRFGPIGLAYVRREVSPGETVRLECDPPIPCRVRELPFTST